MGFVLFCLPRWRRLCSLLLQIGLVLSLKLILQGCLLIAFGADRKCFSRMAHFLVGFCIMSLQLIAFAPPFKMQPERKQLSQVLMVFVGAQRWASMGVGSTRAHLQVIICPCGEAHDQLSSIGLYLPGFKHFDLYTIIISSCVQEHVEARGLLPPKLCTPPPFLRQSLSLA